MASEIVPAVRIPPHSRIQPLRTTMPELDFESLVRETQSHLRAYIAGMGISRHEVDDIAQDVYLELHKNPNSIPPDVAPLRWLKGIARNLSLNHIRKNARRGRLFREAIADLLADAESQYDEPQHDGAVQTALKDCFSRLPSRSQKMLNLRYREDLPANRIAEAMASSAEAVRIALFRIRGLLRECLASAASSEEVR